VALVAVSLLPAWYGLGPVYLAGAALGGAWFLLASVRLARVPTRENARANFHASLGQLALLLAGAMVEPWFVG
jgi:protoheme IX farnesyltransferase